MAFSRIRRGACLLAVLLSSAAAASCGGSDGLPTGDEPVDLDATEFSTRIDNPFWPMRPGSRWVYRESAPGEPPQRVVVKVTPRTRRIANGVEARVVRDVVSEDGRPVEVTADWYAQDEDGSVWYLGEDTAEYEGGRVVSRAGSWEAGVDGAEPGVIMPADPEPGLEYRQEHYAGQAEDRAAVLSVDEQVEAPFGHFEGVVLTKEFNPLEPRVLEYKLYARGVGPVLALDVSGASGREELLSFNRGRGG